MGQDHKSPKHLVGATTPHIQPGWGTNKKKPIRKHHPLLSTSPHKSMATILSTSALLSISASASASASSSSSIAPPKPSQSHLPIKLQLIVSPSRTANLRATLTAAAAAVTLLSATTTPPSLAAALSPPPNYTTYYGMAAGAASYGGYGGNASKRDQAEYTYDVPEGWKERSVSKVEKGTNGTDSEFFNPKKRSEKEYLTFLPGFRALAPKDVVLNNLALSDVELQDLIAGADALISEERNDEKGQTYYDYEIDGLGSHSLISVTCTKNKLYAHFVNAPAPEWNKDQDMLRHLHESFKTVD